MKRQSHPLLPPPLPLTPPPPTLSRTSLRSDRSKEWRRRVNGIGSASFLDVALWMEATHVFIYLFPRDKWSELVRTASELARRRPPTPV